MAVLPVIDRSSACQPGAASGGAPKNSRGGFLANISERLVAGFASERRAVSAPRLPTPALLWWISNDMLGTLAHL